MTPKEKARELVDRFHPVSKGSLNEDVIKDFEDKKIEYKNSKFTAMMRYSHKYHAKHCALICVDEMIKESKSQLFPRIIYWNEVKQEINKL